MKPRVAIVCDWLTSRGGAERVILSLSEMYPEAPIFTSIYNEKNLPEFKNKNVITSFINSLPLAHKKHYFYLPLMPYAFENFDLSKFDIVISSSHSCAKGIITKPKTLHICYCHSPMRYAWDSCNEYINQYGLPGILKNRAEKMLHNLRQWDRLSAERVDFFVTNSEHVKKRIQKYYRKEAAVIYPPIETDIFRPAPETKVGKYFLAVGRLTPYKKFDLIIETFNELQLPLVIVGRGKEEKRLKKMAGRFITFVGSISDEELARMYQGAHALIFPQTEDFGIIPVEAMSCGTPVIAYADGGALETVEPGVSGLLFSKQNKDELKKTILELNSQKWDPKKIRKQAEKFDRSVFETSMYEFIDEKWAFWKREMF